MNKSRKCSDFRRCGAGCSSFGGWWEFLLSQRAVEEPFLRRFEAAESDGWPSPTLRYAGGQAPSLLLRPSSIRTTPSPERVIDFHPAVSAIAKGPSATGAAEGSLDSTGGSDPYYTPAESTRLRPEVRAALTSV